MAKIMEMRSTVSNSSLMPRFARKPGMMMGGVDMKSAMPKKGSVGTLGRMGGKGVKLSNTKVSLPKKGGNGRNVTKRITGTVR